MPKEIRTGLLLDFYGALLTERQQLCLDLYFNQDLSLAEIAEQEGISRQAVRDSLLRGEHALHTVEDKLGLFRRYSSQRRLMELLCHAVEQGDRVQALSLIGAVNALWDE